MSELTTSYRVIQIRTQRRTLVVEAKNNGVIGAALRGKLDHVEGWVDDEPERWRLLNVTIAKPDDVVAYQFE